VSTTWQQKVDALRSSAITPPDVFATFRLPDTQHDEGRGLLLTELLSPATLEWLEKKKEGMVRS